MKTTKHYGISLLLILALIFSTIAVVVPPAAVQAVTQFITITYPASGNITYVQPGGLVTVGSTVVDTSSADRYVNYQVYSTSLGTIYNQNLLSANATVSKSFNIDITASQGLYNLRLIPQDNTSISATNLGSIYVDSTAPTVSLSSPASGACWKGGMTQNICWTASDAASSDNVTIYADLSVDGGSTWATYPILAGVSSRQGYWCTSYLAPTSNYPACMVRIKALDRALNDSGWIYSPVFAILNTGPTINITSPTGSPSWNGSSSHDLKATITGSGSSVSYMIGLWKASANTENLTTGWGSGTFSSSVYSLVYPWTVSGNKRGSDFQIGIWARDCAGNVTGPQMSGFFTIKDIVAPTPAVTIPTTGTSWYAGATENITWTCTDNVLGEQLHCTLYYSATGTDPYTYIYEADYNQGSNYYTWTIPSISGTGYKIKLVCCDKETPTPNCTTVYSSTFTILSPCTGVPSVTICSPTATGISWAAGTVQNITWTVSDTQSTTSRVTILIELSTDGGSNWLTPAVATLSNQPQASSCSGSFPWAVPSLSTSPLTNCVIRVTATNICGNRAYSQSTYPFTITPDPSGCTLWTGTIALYPGWNLMSLNLIPSNTDINSVLATVMSNVTSVWYFTGGSSGVWQSFAPGAPSSLTTMTDGRAYWIYINGSTQVDLVFQGRKSLCPPNIPSPTYPITGAGWWMTGFKSDINKLAANYLPGSPTGSVAYPIYGFDYFNQYYTVNATDNMTPGSGYWINFNNACTISGGVD